VRVAGVSCSRLKEEGEEDQDIVNRGVFEFVHLFFYNTHASFTFFFSWFIGTYTRV